MAATRYSTDMQKSIYGRRLGISHKDYLVGPKGYAEPFETLSAASTMESFGTTVLTGSTGTYTIQAPERLGQQKEIINASSISTAAMAIIRSTAAGACSFLSPSSAYGSTAGGDSGDVKRMNLISVGSIVTLRAISASQWAIVSKPTTALFTVSTSS